jgi:hypothetical protein
MLRLTAITMLSVVISCVAGCSEPSFSNYMGDTLQAVTQQEGQPAHLVDGHYGNPPVSFVQQFGVCKTGIWYRGGCTIYCTFEKQGQQWIMIDTSSVPDGTQF